MRRLIIFAPSGGAELAGYLRREYGLPLLEYCRAPHLVLLFSETAIDVGAPILRLHAPAPDLLDLSICPKTIFVPDDSEVLPFMAVLWESGRLTVRDVTVFPCEDT